MLHVCVLPTLYYRKYLLFIWIMVTSNVRMTYYSFRWLTITDLTWPKPEVVCLYDYAFLCHSLCERRLKTENLLTTVYAPVVYHKNVELRLEVWNFHSLRFEVYWKLFSSFGHVCNSAFVCEVWKLVIQGMKGGEEQPAEWIFWGWAAVTNKGYIFTRTGL